MERDEKKLSPLPAILTIMKNILDILEEIIGRK